MAGINARRSSKNIFVILLFTCAASVNGCAPNVSDKPASEMTDSEVLTSIGYIARNPESYKNRIAEIESEVNRRDLLDVHDMDAARRRVLYVGMKGTIVVAGFGSPVSVVTNLQEPSLQVWNYITLQDVEIDEIQDRRVNWISYNSWYNSGINQMKPHVQIFVKEGYVIGYVAITHHRSAQDSMPMLYAAQSGKIWNIPSNIARPWAFHGCILSLCDNISVR